jgi:hypothetical protein
LNKTAPHNTSAKLAGSELELSVLRTGEPEITWTDYILN